MNELDPIDLSPVVELLAGRRVVVLSGAGCSTESGIPDYRGEGTRRRARRPVQYKEFIGSEVARRRYWARAVVGWPKFIGARPNPAHRALASLESANVVSGVITQNVDRLHQAAGSRRVVELHGALADVVCLDCGAHEPREALQERLLSLNPGWLGQAYELAPDGDADLDPAAVAGFQVAGCCRCGGPLKPDVVFLARTSRGRGPRRRGTFGTTPTYCWWSELRWRFYRAIGSSKRRRLAHYRS